MTSLRTLVLASAVAAPLLALATGAGAQQHYSCAKPENAARAACKSASGGVSPKTAKARAAKIAKATPDKPVVTPKAAPDTSSPAAGGSAKVVSFKDAAGKPVHFDCSKPENATVAACKK